MYTQLTNVSAYDPRIRNLGIYSSQNDPQNAIHHQKQQTAFTLKPSSTASSRIERARSEIMSQVNTPNPWLMAPLMLPQTTTEIIRTFGSQLLSMPIEAIHIYPSGNVYIGRRFITPNSVYRPSPFDHNSPSAPIPLSLFHQHSQHCYQKKLQFDLHKLINHTSPFHNLNVLVSEQNIEWQYSSQNIGPQVYNENTMFWQKNAIGTNFVVNALCYEQSYLDKPLVGPVVVMVDNGTCITVEVKAALLHLALSFFGEVGIINYESETDNEYILNIERARSYSTPSYSCALSTASTLLKKGLMYFHYDTFGKLVSGRRPSMPFKRDDVSSSGDDSDDEDNEKTSESTK